MANGKIGELNFRTYILIGASTGSTFKLAFLALVFFTGVIGSAATTSSAAATAFFDLVALGFFGAFGSLVSSDASSLATLGGLPLRFLTGASSASSFYSSFLFLVAKPRA